MNSNLLKQQITEARQQRAGLAVKMAEMAQKRAQLQSDIALIDNQVGSLALVAADMDLGIAKMMQQYLTPAARIERIKGVDIPENVGKVLDHLGTNKHLADVARTAAGRSEYTPTTPADLASAYELMMMGVLALKPGLDSTYVVTAEFKEWV